MQAIAHAGTHYAGLNRSNRAIAVIVAWSGVVEHAEGVNLTFVTDGDDYVSVLSFSAVSVVHMIIGFVVSWFTCRNGILANINAPQDPYCFPREVTAG